VQLVEQWNMLITVSMEMHLLDILKLVLRDTVGSDRQKAQETQTPQRMLVYKKNISHFNRN